MSLDVYLQCSHCHHSVFSRNITHNLTEMADRAGLYKVCWRPEEIGVKLAGQAIPLLEQGFQYLVNHRAELESLNPANGWGSYEGLVDFVQEYLSACREHPELVIEVSR